MTVIYHRPFFKTMLLVVKGLKILSLRPCLKGLKMGYFIMGKGWGNTASICSNAPYSRAIKTQALS